MVVAVKNNAGTVEQLDGRHSARHKVGAQSGRVVQLDIQPGFHTGADAQGLGAGQALDGPFYSGGQGGDHRADDGAFDLADRDAVNIHNIPQLHRVLILCTLAVRGQARHEF